MDGELRGGVVHVGGDARQRYHDSRGYGYSVGGNEIALSRVEAAHLLFRGDLESVDGMGFREFFARSTGDGFGVRFLVYADLRARGFYLSPARDGWVAAPSGAVDFVVYPRGAGPRDGETLYAVRVVGERASIPAADLEPGMLAVVDEESEVTYFAVDHPTIDGTSDVTLPHGHAGELLGDRVLSWEPPESLYHECFFGQPLSGRTAQDDDAVQLSLVEAAHLASLDAIQVEGGFDALVERGREVEGERFDRRLSVYDALRARGVVPKTGYKFGADFRTYASVDSVETLGHSELLVRVLPGGHEFSPRDLALDVRLAHGVRKRMVFALVDDGEIEWLSLERATP